jgi:acetoacetate decarboxylase
MNDIIPGAGEQTSPQGDYYEVSQGIFASLDGTPLSLRPAMYARNVAAILNGREIWGLPKKLGSPTLSVQHDTFVGTLSPLTAWPAHTPVKASRVTSRHPRMTRGRRGTLRPSP